jgi:hypothetical protein
MPMKVSNNSAFKLPWIPVELARYKFKIQLRSGDKIQLWIRAFILMVMLVLMLFYSLKIDPSGQSLSSDIAFFIFFYFFIDIAITLMWYKHGTLIEIKRLIPFPVSSLSLFKYQLTELIVDAKTIIFIVPLSVIFSKILTANVTMGILSLIFFILFFISLQIWMLNIYIIFIRQFEMLRNYIMIGIFVLVVLIRALSELFGLTPLHILDPLTSWITTGTAVHYQQWAHIIILILITIAVGTIAGSWMIKRKEYRL